MKLLLLNPPFIDRFSRTSRSPAVAKGGTIYYPLWLSYAAGALEQDGVEVKLVDAPADCISNDLVSARLGDFTPDVIALDTSTPSIYADVKSAEFYKKRYPTSLIVLVGTHPSAMPEWTLNQSPAVDAVARGEYDYTLRDLCAAIRNGRGIHTVAGLSYRDGENIRHSPNRPLIANLDDLPFVTSVYKKHLSIRNYSFAAARYPMVMTITGRGCPFGCFFCVYPQTFHSRAYRPRSARNVVEEFIYVKRNLPEAKEIGIEDDTFTVDKKRCEEICNMLIEERVGMRWYCNARADIPLDLLFKMKAAGCRMITVGFESGSQEILDSMHKGIRLETMRQFVRDAKKAGILVHGCIMAGNPGETEETIRDSFRFAVELDCDSMQFFPLFVYTGTEAYRWAEGKGYLKTTNFREWLDEKGDYRCVIDLPGLPGKRITELCKGFYARYHLRPRYVLNKIRQGLRHPGEGLRTVRSALVFFRFMLRDRLHLKRNGNGHGWDEYWDENQQLRKFGSINTSYREVVDKLMRLSTERSRCVELGAGTGTYAVELAARGRNCMATDISPSALRIAKIKGKNLYDVDMKLLAADIFHLPFKEGTFDLIFSDGVIEHLDIPRALDVMKRLLKPGGWMAATVPNGSITYAIIYYGLYPFRNRPYEAWLNRRRWAELLCEAGYDNVEVSKCGSILDGILMRIFKRFGMRFKLPVWRIYYFISGKAPGAG
ncbi:MAG: methyltransferase domain-containing protein, partial [bacterium]